MKRSLLTAVALTAGSLLWVAAANADVITTGASAGTVGFTKLATGGVSFTTAGFTTSPAAFDAPNGTTLVTGTTTFGAMAGTTGAEAAGVFPITPAVTETFTFTATGGATGSMTASISWAGIKDGTSTPQFDNNAILTVTSDTVTNAAFLADFPVGGTGQADFTVNLPGVTTLAGLATDASTTGTFSSGEVIPTPPAPPAVPEPASLALLGTGLAGLGLIRRRRKAA